MLSRAAIVATPTTKEAPKGPEPRAFPVSPAIAAVACFVGGGLSKMPLWTDWLRGAGVVMAAITLIIWSTPKAVKGARLALPFYLELLAPIAVLVVGLVVASEYVKNDETSSILQMSLAIGGVAVIGWGIWLAQMHRPHEFQLMRDRILLAIGCLAALGYCNFGHLHFGVFIHTWDTYHYYMGGKYFPEVGYERLYDCSITADSETGRKVPAERIVTDLRTNVMVKASSVLDDVEGRCKSHFTPDRWKAFKDDIVFFRNRVNEKRWEEMHHDHGFNATPVWILAGYLFTNTGAATLNQITAMDLIDPVYLIAMALMLLWAFGPRVFSVGMIMLGTNWASRFFYWTGGAMLRHDWLFCVVAVVCLLKKGKPFWAGIALAYATLLRLFPGLMVAGPLLAGLEYTRVRFKLGKGAPYRDDEKPRIGLDAKLPHWLSPEFARFVVGGLLATVLLVGATFTFLGGAETWRTFAANTKKHASTPLTNHMGLRTIISSRPSTIGQVLRDGKLLDAWSVWKDTRVQTYNQSRPVFYLLILASLVLLYFAVKGGGGELWFSASLGIGMIVIGAELTNYYYVFFVGMAAAHQKRREVGLILAALCATCIVIMLTPLQDQSTWQDEVSAMMSVASVLGVIAVWLLFTPWARRYVVGEESPVTLAGLFSTAAAPLVSSGPGPKSKKKKK